MSKERRLVLVACLTVYKSYIKIFGIQSKNTDKKEKKKDKNIRSFKGFCVPRKRKKEDKMIMVRKRYQFIPSRNIDDQRILQFDWMRVTTSQNEPKVVRC